MSYTNLITKRSCNSSSESLCILHFGLKLNEHVARLCLPDLFPRNSPLPWPLRSTRFLRRERFLCRAIFLLFLFIDFWRLFLLFSPFWVLFLSTLDLGFGLLGGWPYLRFSFWVLGARLIDTFFLSSQEGNSYIRHPAPVRVLSESYRLKLCSRSDTWSNAALVRLYTYVVITGQSMSWESFLIYTFWGWGVTDTHAHSKSYVACWKCTVSSL